ncbi:MAG: DUF3368 domain-containing protein [Bacteroidota bacterium]
MKSLIISDTSPITNLIKIGQLDLLGRLFGEIIVPKEVYKELADYEKQKAEIDKRSWIKIIAVRDQEAVAKLNTQLDPGEAEAIILAQELDANLLIIDERKGRRIAEGYGLHIIGLLGILVRGKQKGHISEIKPLLNSLMQEVGFRVSQSLYEDILREVGELGKNA